MKGWEGKRYWIVGASDGLGAALAKEMSKAGVDLIISSRTKSQLEKVAGELSRPCKTLQCDVRDSKSVEVALNRLGSIDGIVFMPAVYWPIPADKWHIDKALEMADVNFMGAFRVLGSVIKEFVERDSGHLVITGSMVESRGLPNSFGYTASKVGLSSLAGCIYFDLKYTNVRVQLVKPGYIDTRLTKKNSWPMPFMLTPEVAAKKMFRHMNTDRYCTTFPWQMSLIEKIIKLMPNWIYFKLF